MLVFNINLGSGVRGYNLGVSVRLGKKLGFLLGNFVAITEILLLMAVDYYMIPCLLVKKRTNEKLLICAKNNRSLIHLSIDVPILIPIKH